MMSLVGGEGVCVGSGWGAFTEYYLRDGEMPLGRNVASRM